MNMQRQLKAVISLLTLIFLSLAGSVSAAVSGVPASGPQFSLSPINPQFIQYFKTTHPTITKDGHCLGVIPDPIDLKALGNVSVHAAPVITSFPGKFDLRTDGGRNYVTPVRDQYPSGSCWAFGTYGSMESCILKATNGIEKDDFSENNIKNRLAQNNSDGFDETANGGGSVTRAVAFLTRWNIDSTYASGPAPESWDPFVGSSTTSPVLAPSKHVQNVLFLPDRSSDTDASYIPYLKSALIKYGASAMFFLWSPNYYKDSTYAYYNPTTNSGGGHEITVVGWDDSFPASNFVSGFKPSQPGAWIIKNSWGTSFGNNGYFYMSYYDHSLNYCKVLLNPEVTTNYTHCYQYDPLGWCDSLGNKNGSDTEGWAANIFAGINGQSLKAVSFYTPVPLSAYEISVYTGVSAGKPTSGSRKIIAQSGVIDLAGYHTIKLNQPVPLTSEKFSVIVKFSTPFCYKPIAVECAVPNYSSHAKASPGQSFVGYVGTSWTDTTTIDPTCNVCIKAFSS